MIEKVVLVQPRGFCAGVARAVQTVKDCLEIFGTPVYVKHQIVHNKNVVEDLEKRGAITVESVDEIPNGAVAVFSAHGSPPEHYEAAKNRGVNLIDATCPLVTKVHLEVHRYLKQGYQLVYVGHKGHIEGEGVIAEAHKYGVEIPLVDSVSEVEALVVAHQKLAYLTQTTLSVEETENIIQALKKKFPSITAPPISDICYATTNRQKAIKILAKQVDVVFVIGSKNSSNSTRLMETARNEGVDAYLIDGIEDIEVSWTQGKTSVGISAGASAPENVVQEVVDYFKKQGATVERLEAVKEDMHFSEPIELSRIKEEKSGKI
jgi:4-hydroxy-3-methylbut-2-enyl diphosphate reductase